VWCGVNRNRKWVFSYADIEGGKEAGVFENMVLRRIF